MSPVSLIPLPLYNHLNFVYPVESQSNQSKLSILIFKQPIHMANVTVSHLPHHSNSTFSSAAPSTPPPPSTQAGIVILVLAFLLGFPGNLFVVWSVLCRVHHRSVTCLLVLNLAIADALVLLSAPFFLRLLAGGKGWEFGNGMCKTVHYLCCVNMYVSIYLICLMSLDRWLAVIRPFLSQRLRKKRTLYIVMLVIWIMAFLMALPMPFYRSNLQKNNTTICMPYHWDSVSHEVFQYLMETLLGFLIPFTFIVVCYTSVICRLRSAMFRGRVKGSLLILLIITAFACFWLPYHIINILQVIGLLQGRSHYYSVAHSARSKVTAFAFFSSSVNPLLYVFAGSSHIRRAGLGFMAKLFEGTYSDHSSTSGRRSTIHTSSSGLTRNAVRNGGVARNKSCVEEEPAKWAESNAREELKTLNTML
ncbi:leukotriene B4 receptor 1 isoform X1 [Hemibagrus wyckioides]|uniref:leukotriene B4 receptor 1 isoform X1 n=1 Tax=Hemibagrus wyckioides TaxID=337641 RepID=UPI00266B6912|nr:leukotriene B4 receptor 1 isoform X1 [Hemibagrus wyckioides]